MEAASVDPARIRSAWEGRVSGCQLGKPVEVLSMLKGREALETYLQEAGALPLRDYVPLVEGTLVERFGRACCRGQLVRAEPDDDINYTVLALLLLEEKGVSFDTVDVARAWLRLLPAGVTWTAERAAYRTLLARSGEYLPNGGEAGFDLNECSDNEYNDWIGAQIPADLYGWVCPGCPALAAELARRDAALSHRGEGVYGAVFVAALGAAIPAAKTLDAALDAALAQIPADSGSAAAVRLGRQLSGESNAVAKLHERYEGLSPVHTLNNLALVVWALCSADGDFGAAIGEAVAAGWDTDCNGATVGGLFGLTGAPIPDAWIRPWAGRVGLGLAGHSELTLDELVDRTVAVARSLT
jgi:ADP-ribosylglycohydrolase